MRGLPEARDAIAARLSLLGELSVPEVDYLRALQTKNSYSAPHTALASAGQPYRTIKIIRSGWVQRSTSLPDGRRQIISFALPGDILCLQSYFFAISDEDVTTLTSVELSEVQPSKLDDLLERFPRLGATIFWCNGEPGLWKERLVTLGQRSGRERVAHFLIDLWQRLALVGLCENASFTMPVTQELMGEALGLSPVHINRILKQLRAERLISVCHKGPTTVTINDVNALADAAKFEHDHEGRLVWRGHRLPWPGLGRNRDLAATIRAFASRTLPL